MYINMMMTQIEASEGVENVVIEQPNLQRSKGEKVRIPKDYQMFMGHMPHKDIDYIETVLKEYAIGEYVIGLEITPRTGIEHYHFLVEMSDADYTRFAKRVFKDKYKLCGRATKGAPRQYGKVHDIRDLEKASAYTIKDGNIRTNMSQDRIRHLTELSYEKKGTDILAKISEYVDDNYIQDWPSHYDRPKIVALLVIDYLREHKTPLRASTIRYYTIHCLAYSELTQFNKMKNIQLYDIMFPHGI
jgi:hypothetical protein